MFEELYAERQKTTFKSYLLVLLCVAVVGLWFRQCQILQDSDLFYHRLMHSIDEGRELDKLPLHHVMALLEYRWYVGEWECSIKASELLLQESGRIEIAAQYNTTKHYEGYVLRVTVYDGEYYDDGGFNIYVSGASMTANTHLEEGKILYQVDHPMIASYHNVSRTQPHNPNSLYINKLKLKLNHVNNQLTLDILLSAEYQLNIVSKGMVQYPHISHQVLLSVLLVLLTSVQIYGLYFLYEDIYRERMCVSRYSVGGLLVIVGSDGTEALLLLTLCLEGEVSMAVYGLPFLLQLMQLFWMQMRILKLIDKTYKTNPYLFHARCYGTILLFYAITFVVDLGGWLFVLYAGMVILPQVHRNYVVGHKMKASLNQYLMFVLPRYIIVGYLRAYEYNVFHLKPNYMGVVMVVMVVGLGVGLLVAQKKYGVRAILPKFLHPKEFRYFMNEPEGEEIDCSICYGSLRQRPILDSQSSERYSLREEEIYNNVVMTPCKHKFHVECLRTWMEKKLECPYCRRLLPPLQDSE